MELAAFFTVLLRQCKLEFFLVKMSNSIFFNFSWSFRKPILLSTLKLNDHLAILVQLCLKLKTFLFFLGVLPLFIFKETFVIEGYIVI
jgi:hypothetical protein